jgi:hypothetical protein
MKTAGTQTNQDEIGKPSAWHEPLPEPVGTPSSLMPIRHGYFPAAFAVLVPMGMLSRYNAGGA